MSSLSLPIKLLLAGVFLLVVVIVTALIDIQLHFHPLIVIAIMLLATTGTARFITRALE